VVDPCEKRVVILPVGDDAGAYQVHLDEGPAADYEPSAVALATVPGSGDFKAIVAQGHYLHTIDYSMSNTDGTIDDIQTIDILEAIPGFPLFEVNALYAADPIELDGETYYLLYLAGTFSGTDSQAAVFVFDQEVLLNWPYDPDPLIMAGFPLGTAGEAVDVAVGATTEGGHKQEAFASVLNVEGENLVQRFYRITVEDGQTASASLDPWNDEGIPFTGTEPGSLGLDFDSLGLEAHGAFQTSRIVADLYTGESTCDLMYDPTDVAIWGPDSWGGHVQFTTVSNQIGQGALLGYADGVCPYGGEGALTMAVDSRPLSLALSSDTGDSPWVYTAFGSGSVLAIQVSIVADETGAAITVLDQFPVDTDGCPSDIVIRDPAYNGCVRGKYGDPGPPDDEEENCPTTKYCKLHPTDPLCISTLCAKKPAT
jgi:hypothetical protein